MARLFLVRHGENPADPTRSFSHRAADLSLTKRGTPPLLALHPNCAVSDLELHFVNGHPTGRLARWADTGHLSGDARPQT